MRNLRVPLILSVAIVLTQACKVEAPESPVGGAGGMGTAADGSPSSPSSPTAGQAGDNGDCRCDGGQSGAAFGGALTGSSGTAGTGETSDAGNGGAGSPGQSCVVGVASGERIALQKPTATFSQTVAYNFSVTRLIDGVLDDNRGWAILQNNGTVSAQTAALQTTVNTPQYSGGTRLTFVLTQNYNLTGAHAIGRFRLSVTTSDRTSFADGNDGATTPGNVGPEGIWSVLMPTIVCGLDDVAMAIADDGSVLVTPNSFIPMVYTVIAETPLTGITGIRLEALNDSSLPFEGPGLQVSNGNFVLTEFEAYSASL